MSAFTSEGVEKCSGLYSMIGICITHSILNFKNDKFDTSMNEVVIERKWVEFKLTPWGQCSRFMVFKLQCKLETWIRILPSGVFWRRDIEPTLSPLHSWQESLQERCLGNERIGNCHCYGTEIHVESTSYSPPPFLGLLFVQPLVTSAVV